MDWYRGATCYLNSLLQALFMNPQFREAIYSLPLCDGALDQPTNFVKGGKRKMLLEIQRCFVMLQCSNRSAISTYELTKSFGWNQNEGQI